MNVVYNGIKTTKAQLRLKPTKPLYCALIVSKTVVQRGYWDGRVDYMECFDSNAEALSRSNANPPIPQELILFLAQSKRYFKDVQVTLIEEPAIMVSYMQDLMVRSVAVM